MYLLGFLLRHITHEKNGANSTFSDILGTEPNALCKASGPLPKPSQMDIPLLICGRKSQEALTVVKPHFSVKSGQKVRNGRQFKTI